MYKKNYRVRCVTTLCNHLSSTFIQLLIICLLYFVSISYLPFSYAAA